MASSTTATTDAATSRTGVVVLGSVDHGKSSLVGHMLARTGAVDERMLERLELEASSKAGVGWKYAFLLDSEESERERGKTEELGRAPLTTPGGRGLYLLDAPGHEGFVPEMIAGAAQGEAALVVVSARSTEFEEGMDGGQTKEHLVLARAAGIRSLVVAVNKMDDPTVAWSETRFCGIAKTLRKYLTKSLGYASDALVFVPVSAWTGQNIGGETSATAAAAAPDPNGAWYQGPSLLDALDALPERDVEANAHDRTRIPVADWYVDPASGLHVLGVVETGTVAPGMTLTLMPGGATADVVTVNTPHTHAQGDAGLHAIKTGRPGTTVVLGVRGLEPTALGGGVVLIDTEPAHPLTCVSRLVAQVLFLGSGGDGTGIIAPGYRCIAHIHSAVRECEIIAIRDTSSTKAKAKTKTRNKTKAKAKAKAKATTRTTAVTHASPGAHLQVLLRLARPVAVEPHSSCAKTGTLALRSNSGTVAVGVVTRTHASPSPSPSPSPMASSASAAPAS